MIATAHAPGKVILAGEHAVVYGQPALAVSLGLGVKAEVSESRRQWEYGELITKAIEVSGGDKCLEVTIKSKLPRGAGMGSSAAVAAAVIKAVRKYYGRPTEEDELFQLTMECEKIAHGNPSGIDPATVVYGGLISFTKGKPIERLKVKKPIEALLIESGKPKESTKEMVEIAARYPRKTEMNEGIGKLVKEIRKRLVKGEDITQFINMNGILLEEWGVVGEKAKRLSKKLRDMGNGVKITGAGGVRGGSGTLIAVGEHLELAKKLLDNKQIRYWETKIGER